MKLRGIKRETFNMATRTEGKGQNSCQGQSIGTEPLNENIMFPRVLDTLNGKKVCRYLLETIRFKIKNLIKQMSLLAANFDNFSNSVGTSTVGLTVDNLFSALAIIETYQHMGEISGVFDRRQIWGALGLLNDLVTSNQFGGSPAAQSEGLSSGFVSKVAGIDIYNSNQLAAAVSSAQKGGIFTRDAIGWGYVGPELVVEVKREADFIRDRYNAHFFAGTVELRDAAGVEIHTKTVA